MRVEVRIVPKESFLAEIRPFEVRNIAYRGDVGGISRKYESCQNWPGVGLPPSLVAVLRGGIGPDRNSGRFCTNTGVFQNRPISAKTAKFSSVGDHLPSALV